MSEKKILRCAIYTRKSTEEGLDMDYNTLDAQREAGEKYIEAMRGDPFQSFSGAGALRSYYTSGILLHRPDESRPERTLLFELRNGKEIKPKTVKRGERGWQVILEKPTSHKVIEQSEPIIRILLDEAAQGRVYTARQFSDAFSNHEALGGSRAIRNKMQALADAGIVKFFKNGDAYGLPLPQRTHQGYLWADGMRLPDGISVSATHQKHAATGDIVPVPGSTDEWES